MRGVHQTDLPATVQPLWTGIVINGPVPSILEFSVFNTWIGEEGEWEFRFRMITPGGRFDDQRISHHRFAPGVDSHFLDAVRVRMVGAQPGTHICSILCGEEEVMRYPLTIQANPSR